MPKITVLPHETLCPEGVEFEAKPGETLCLSLLQHGVPIEHACDMACACTTCHVVVGRGFDSLEPSSETEDDMLDKAWGLTSQSRLSCQVEIGDTDLTIEIPKYTINHAREN